MRGILARTPLAWLILSPSQSSQQAFGLQDGWMPEQRMTRIEAVTCFTAGAAYAEFAEERRGMLRVGMDADLTAFDRDVMAVPAEELTKLRVTHTFVGGRDELTASLH